MHNNKLKLTEQENPCCCPGSHLNDVVCLWLLNCVCKKETMQAELFEVIEDLIERAHPNAVFGHSISGPHDADNADELEDNYRPLL